MQPGEYQDAEGAVLRGELERGARWLLLAPCTPPARAAAVASAKHFGCRCWYRYVKLDSLCLGGSCECIHRLSVGFAGWDITFLGKTSKTDHGKSNLAEEGSVLAAGSRSLVMTPCLQMAA